jgi:4-aminobutyrate aminotransferase-like enzyme
VALGNRAIIERVGLLERASRIGARMRERLRPAASLAAVTEIRGSGAMFGVELVADRDAGPVAAAAGELGVIVRTGGRKS